MKKSFILPLLLMILIQPVYSAADNDNSWYLFKKNPQREIKKVINSQERYSNKNNYDKYMATYDKSYVSSDGFDYETYSKLVKDIWAEFKNTKYSMKINSIKVDVLNATVNISENATANIPATKGNVTGELKSTAESIYYMKKINGKWKVVSDFISYEQTSMLYGDAKNIDIKLEVPEKVEPNTEYTASLEFVPPKGSLAVASISSEKVEYPQKKTQEVYRSMPDDNILERLFTSNNENSNEYVIASVGLTKTDVSDLSIKLSLTGYGYVVRRVNVISEQKPKAETNEQKQ